MPKRMVVIVPSRGRPQNIARLIEAWNETHATAKLLVALDKDDPEIPRYMEVVSSNRCSVTVGPRRRLCGTLNHEAMRRVNDHEVIGFMGDDHLPRTMQFDELVSNALNELETGIVYGNDLIQGANLPTAAFMTSDIIRTLGYMVPPPLVHFYADNFWGDAGHAIGKLRYLPDVIIEHCHPLAGRAEWDNRYEDAATHMGPDAAAYDLYQKSGEFARDVVKLRRLVNEKVIV